MSSSTKDHSPGGTNAARNDLASDMCKAFQTAWDRFVAECGKSPGSALSKEEYARFAKFKPWSIDESQDRCPDMHDRVTTLDTGYHIAQETKSGSSSSLVINSMSVADNKIGGSKHMPELKVSGVTHGSIFNKPQSFLLPRMSFEELRLAAQPKAVAFMNDRVQYWKAKLAEQKDVSSTSEPEEELLAEVIDFNSSMLSREDYDQMIADRAADKNIILNKHENEEVSESEKKAAITALIYNIDVLKAASSSRRHQMVSEVLHPSVRQLQPSVAFEMTALLLDIDTKGLLDVTVDGDALYDKTKAVAKA
ncbi:hypothetical protein E4T47_08105 [Aureobasidium subglaciale]|nr:hypothetical protein E4T47_08105 [Aureobasidium subglaciale]